MTIKPINVTIGRREGHVDMAERDPASAQRYWDLQAKIDEAEAALREYRSQQDAVVTAFRKTEQAKVTT